MLRTAGIVRACSVIDSNLGVFGFVLGGLVTIDFIIKQIATKDNNGIKEE